VKLLLSYNYLNVFVVPIQHPPLISMAKLMDSIYTNEDPERAQPLQIGVNILSVLYVRIGKCHGGKQNSVAEKLDLTDGVG